MQFNLEVMGDETSESDRSGNDQDKHAKKSRKAIMKAKHRLQKYRYNWERLPQFQSWLCSDNSSSFKAKCRLCNISLQAELSIIKRHGKSTKHLERCADICPKVQKTVKENIIAVNNNVLQAEIQLCGFFVAHNIPFSIMDHLSAVLKNCFNDSKIAQSLQLKRTKTTGIITNVIGAAQKERLIQMLKCNKFSILTDESTDIAAVKTTCIAVRFYHKDIGSITSQFWDLDQVFNSQSTSANKNISDIAEHLFSIILE